MNFLKIVLFLTIVTLCAASKQDEVCAWQSNVTALVGKLTPAGQKLALQISTDFWSIFYPGVQPVYDYIGKNMNATLQKLYDSDDASKLEQLELLLGVGNWSAGVGASPRDLCQDYKSAAALVNSMSAENQKSVMEVVRAIEGVYKIVLPSIINIHMFLDYKQYEQLKSTENKDTLNAITTLYAMLSSKSINFNKINSYLIFISVKKPEIFRNILERVSQEE